MKWEWEFREGPSSDLALLPSSQKGSLSQQWHHSFNGILFQDRPGGSRSHLGLGPHNNSSGNLTGKGCARKDQSNVFCSESVIFPCLRPHPAKGLEERHPQLVRLCLLLIIQKNFPFNSLNHNFIWLRTMTSVPVLWYCPWSTWNGEMMPPSSKGLLGVLVNYPVFLLPDNKWWGWESSLKKKLRKKAKNFS